MHALLQYSSGVLPEKACFSTVLNTSMSHFASFKTPAIPSAFELCKNPRPVSAQCAPVIMAKITPHLSPGELETYKLAAVVRFHQNPTIATSPGLSNDKKSRPARSSVWRTRKAHLTSQNMSSHRSAGKLHCQQLISKLHV